MKLKEISKLIRRYTSELKTNEMENVPSLWGRYSDDASHLVNWYDFNKTDLDLNRKRIDSNKDSIKIKSIIWFIPEFDNPFWGGIHTILRFAAYFTENKEVENSFVIFGNTSKELILEKITSAFPELKTSKLYILSSEREMDKINEADASICTLWTTAYYSLKFNKVKKKFYFIQDYEPLFYPAGSTSAQVEETYRFGFYGITNTKSLKQIYEDLYCGNGEYFSPCVDTNVFYSSGRSTKDIYTVFFYARPGHPRNGFELGIASLRMLKEKMGDKVRIVTAGSNWDPQELGIDGIVENLGLLHYEETATLYRECDIALSMMFTKHPSYIPIELMASGCLVVANFNQANAWLLHDGVNCILSPASVSSLCDALQEGLTDIELRKKITKNALDMITNKYSDWNQEIERIFNYMCHVK